VKLAQLDQCPRISASGEYEIPLALLDHLQAEDALVVGARPPQIADLEAHSAEVGLVR
jgi:hypothetical protein